MPIFDYKCEDCGNIFENLEIWEKHKAQYCPKCESQKIHRIMSVPHIRMNPDDILRSVPDPSPPLEELRGKTREGCEGGYEDKPQADTNLKNYTRTWDKHGNAVWREKRRTYFGAGGSRKSSAE